MSLKGIAHGMVWATGQCSCMPRCMHRFWLHTSTMMHASAIGHRGSAPLQACLHATPRASFGLGRTASASLEWHSHCALRRAGVSSRSARDLAKPMKFQNRILIDLFAGSQGSFVCSVLTLVFLLKVSLQHEFLSPYSNPLSLHALVAQGQPLIIWACPLSSRRTP